MLDNETRILLFHDDCVPALQRFENESVDLIITDPPYNLGNFMRKRQTNLKQMRSNFFASAGWDDLAFEDWARHMDAFFRESSRVLKTRGAMIVFMSLMKVETMIRLAQKHRLYYKTTGVWHKTNPMPRNMNLHFINSVEGWLYFIGKEKTGTFNNGSRAIHDFIESSVIPGGEKKYGKHPTQKPEALFEHFIGILSNPDDVVCDPFMGSGTAGVVAKRLNRRFLGVECSAAYCELARRRIANTQEQAFVRDPIEETEA